MVREVNARMLGSDMSLVNTDDREWKINQLLFVDDMVLVVDSEDKLCQLVEEFERLCRRRNLRVNENMS